MSTGRLTMRGRVFQGRVFAPFVLAGGGGAVAITDPNEGWITGSRDRLLIGHSTDRVALSGSRDRLWIAKDKIT
jgi:hypothetical protein